MRDCRKDTCFIFGGVFKFGDEFTVSFVTKDEQKASLVKEGDKGDADFESFFFVFGIKIVVFENFIKTDFLTVCIFKSFKESCDIRVKRRKRGIWEGKGIVICLINSFRIKHDDRTIKIFVGRCSSSRHFSLESVWKIFKDGGEIRIAIERIGSILVGQFIFEIEAMLGTVRRVIADVFLSKEDFSRNLVLESAKKCSWKRLRDILSEIFYIQTAVCI